MMASHLSNSLPGILFSDAGYIYIIFMCVSMNENRIRDTGLTINHIHVYMRTKKQVFYIFSRCLSIRFNTRAK